MNRPRGRPPGRTDTRQRLAGAARESFLRHGYRGTTVRSVAAAAGCDSAMIAHHFGSKQGLFAAAMALPRSPSSALDRALQGDPARAPERILRAVHRYWTDPAGSAAIRTLTAAALTEPQVLQAFAGYVEREIFRRFAEFLTDLGTPRAQRRATAAATVVAGVIFTRYLLAVPSALSAGPLDAQLVDTLRAALFGGAGRRPLPTRQRPPALR